MRLRSVLLPLLPALLAGTLSACGDLLAGASDGTSVMGTVIYPPAAGQAQFTAVIDGQLQTVALAAVGASGAYTVTLPARPPLPAQGNAATLAFTLGHLGGPLGDAACSGQPTVSSAAARTAVLSAGNFQIGGRTTGTLTPMVGVIGGQALTSPFTVTVRSYVYTDRALTVSGTLNCTYAASGTAALNGTVTLAYALKAGWNLIESQTTQAAPDQPVLSVSRTVTPGNVDWRYSPNP